MELLRKMLETTMTRGAQSAGLNVWLTPLPYTILPFMLVFLALQVDERPDPERRKWSARLDFAAPAPLLVRSSSP